MRRLLALLPETLDTDEALAFDIARLKAQAEGRLRDTLGPYTVVAEAISGAVGAGGPSNSRSKRPNDSCKTAVRMPSLPPK